MFTSIELARRIERAETRLLEECARSVEARRPEANVVCHPCAGGVAVYAGPGSPFNKLGGLGFAGVPSDEELELIERAFAARDTPVVAEVSTLAEPAVLERLVARGYALRGFENLSGRTLSAGERFPAHPEVDVVVGADDDFDAWLDVVITGFAHPDTQGVVSHESFPRDVLERDIGDMTRTRGFARYLAYREGELAGGGGVRIQDGLVQMCGAATLPAHRRRGVQTALLHARLGAAAERGCELALVTTQPGSRSQQNVQRQGFELLYARAVLVLQPSPS